jgi:hypothetical protein
MADAIDKAVRAQGGAVVKPHQVKAMILAARRAYKMQADAGLVDDGVDFDAWRRATLHDVVGAAAPDSFRAVTQRDYAAVMDYFGRLAGDKRAEARRSDTIADEERRALWALNLVEGEVAGTLGGREGARRYADALFRKIHKTDRYGATARQVWAVIFTLRKRAKARRSEKPAKTALGARGEAGVHLPPPDGSKRFPAFSRAL